MLRALDPEAFEKTFRAFMAAFAKANGIKLTGVVAIDGKALRGAYERGKSTTPLHMVNVFATEARMALASRKAPGRNEAKGALEVLHMLSLEGCIVTGDALHCNRPFAETVLRRGGHYALALKQNQAKLFDAVARRFARAGKRSVAKRLEPSTHDRRESRRATVIRDTSLAAANRFPGVVAVARITSRRRLQGGRADKPADEPQLRDAGPSDPVVADIADQIGTHQQRHDPIPLEIPLHRQESGNDCNNWSLDDRQRQDQGAAMRDQEGTQRHNRS